MGFPCPPLAKCPYLDTQCRLHCPTEEAKCQALVAACLFPPSSGAREDGTVACRCPLPTLGCSSPMMPLGPGSVLLQVWGSLLCMNVGEEVRGESSHRGQVVLDQLFLATSTLPTAVHGTPGAGSQCLCQTFKAPSPSPSPSLPFWLAPLCALQPTSRAFTDPSTLQTPIPAGPPPWPPQLLRLSSPHCLSGPALSTSITSTVASCPEEGQHQPLLQMEKLRQQRQVIA